MDFAKNYDKLNAAQKQAVDQIDGPVMVVAGPGTGKTQLLSMRVANILRKTDMNPSNILCLTFTESAAANMTERMVKLFGPDAYRVAVHTFHSFGAEVINHYGQYFYSGAVFRTADDLTSAEVLESILTNLPHSSPLASTMNGQFTYLNDLTSTISNLKKAGLAPGEVTKITEQNLKFCEFATPILRKIFDSRVSKKTIDIAASFARDFANYDETELDFATEPPLSQVFANSFARMISACENENSTKPITAWKASWLRKNDAGEIILADELRSQKMAEVAKIYDDYLRKMNERSLYDFDDMILRVTHAVEIFPELKYDLQERFQYILVDEFQDTNDAQMRMLRALTDYDPRPNVMVVGDDDQAIFRFQGADISNIQSFSQGYTDVAKIVLTENYRSSRQILDAADAVVSQANERLANLENLNKTLRENRENGEVAVHHISQTFDEECAWIANDIGAKLAKNSSADIAVIARRHADLLRILPFLADKNIAVDYEREQDVLASEPIRQLELIARVIDAIAHTEHDVAAELLPQILAHPAWGFAPREIYELSIEAHAKRKYWLEIMLGSGGRMQEFAEWIVLQSAISQNESLEITLDELIGNRATEEAEKDTPFDENAAAKEFVSPFKQYFFGEDRLAKNPTQYLEFLSDLRTLRNAAREYRPDSQVVLADFLDMIDAYKNRGKTISAIRKFTTSARVQLLTAHKAKGLEFDTVYVMNATSQNWGQKSRSRGSLLPFPHNMPFSLGGDSNDERIRLVFVALTRAERELIMTSHTVDDAGKALLPLEYLLTDAISQRDAAPIDVSQSIKIAETAWSQPIIDASSELKDLLGDTLSKLKLSATGLNNFIDVTRGGPAHFLLNNILHFPEAKTASAMYGTAIHLTLQRAHLHMSSSGNLKPLEDVIGDFASILGGEQMTDRDYEFYRARGEEALTTFMAKRGESFRRDQIVERNFGSQNIVVDGARLSGAIDLIDVDHDAKTVRVTDYKTGKAAKSWTRRGDYEKIKLRKYRQQLMFYKLLIEHSREFAGYTVASGTLEFVEPAGGEIVRLEMTYDDAELAEFRKLLVAVWNRIMALDLPSTDEFSQDFAGVVAFEKFMLS